VTASRSAVADARLAFAGFATFGFTRTAGGADTAARPGRGMAVCPRRSSRRSRRLSFAIRAASGCVPGCTDAMPGPTAGKPRRSVADAGMSGFTALSSASSSSPSARTIRARSSATRNRASSRWAPSGAGLNGGDVDVGQRRAPLASLRRMPMISLYA
jgi:hypothetical protein